MLWKQACCNVRSNHRYSISSKSRPSILVALRSGRFFRVVNSSLPANRMPNQLAKSEAQIDVWQTPQHTTRKNGSKQIKLSSASANGLAVLWRRASESGIIIAVSNKKPSQNEWMETKWRRPQRRKKTANRVSEMEIEKKLILLLGNRWLVGPRWWSCLHPTRSTLLDLTNFVGRPFGWSVRANKKGK